MRILTIGIDGGDERIIRAMPMPNLHKLLDRNVCLQIEEDLWNRGWVAILSGEHGRETGAFYEKPVLGSTRTTTQKFSIADYGANPAIVPLWAKLSANGHRVGFMNVPSMFPAPEVNGFVVAGGGAGASTSGATRIPVEACYPRHICGLLEDAGYILDTRFVASGIRDANVFIDRLVEMTKKRTSAFTAICSQQMPDMGFVVYRAACLIQYLAMSEIEALISNKCDPKNSFQEKILFFYESFDNQIGGLVDALKPEHLMLVADHGQSPLLFNVSLNAWLQRSGFQVPLSQGASVLKKSAKTLAACLPKGFKQLIKRSAPKTAAKVTGVSANWEQTKAFGMTYVPGIYINDKNRFGGIVASGKEQQDLIKDLVAAFNKDFENQQHNLKARPYRQEYKTAKFESLLPDIWIDHDDTYNFTQQGQYITQNVAYGTITTLEGIDRDVYTGTKGSKPLLCVSPYLADKVKGGDERDLTLAYKLIVRGMAE